MIKRYWLYLLPIAWLCLGMGAYIDNRLLQFLKCFFYCHGGILLWIVIVRILNVILK